MSPGQPRDLCGGIHRGPPRSGSGLNSLDALEIEDGARGGLVRREKQRGSSERLHTTQGRIADSRGGADLSEIRAGSKSPLGMASSVQSLPTAQRPTMASGEPPGSFRSTPFAKQRARGLGRLLRLQ